MTEQAIMTVEKFDKLRRRDFENGAVLEEIRRGLVLLERYDEVSDDALDLFLAMQDYAKVQLEESVDDKGKSYWQGVKDGLRKCYALFTNNPAWSVITKVSTQERPRTAYERWEVEDEAPEM